MKPEDNPIQELAVDTLNVVLGAFTITAIAVVVFGLAMLSLKNLGVHGEMNSATAFVFVAAAYCLGRAQHKL